MEVEEATMRLGYALFLAISVCIYANASEIEGITAFKAKNYPNGTNRITWSLQ